MSVAAGRSDLNNIPSRLTHAESALAAKLFLRLSAAWCFFFLGGAAPLRELSAAWDDAGDLTVLASVCCVFESLHHLAFCLDKTVSVIHQHHGASLSRDGERESTKAVCCVSSVGRRSRLASA